MSYLIFTDQKSFMNYFGQQPGDEAVRLYKRLCDEEYLELQLAMERWQSGVETPEAVTEVADACLDLIYVATGLMHAFGLEPQVLWDEVHRSNIDKIKHECHFCFGTGQLEDGEHTPCHKCHGSGVVYEVRRREDGKVLKPDNWQPPALLPLIEAMLKRGGA